MAVAGRAERERDLASRLDHDDRSQLIFQIAEIAGDRCYERHGVSVAPGATVLDVGANVGVAAVWFATACRAGAVHCFEPAPENLRMLRANTRTLPAVSVHPYGLAASPGVATVTYYAGATAMSGLHADPLRDQATVATALRNLGVGPQDAALQLEGRYEPERHPCELRRLSDVWDGLHLDVVDLLKVDVERAEVEVLDGIDERHWPRIRQLVVEVHDTAGRLAAVTERLHSHGFRTHAEQAAVMHGTDVHLLHAVRP